MGGDRFVYPWGDTMNALAEWDEDAIELSVARTHRVILNTMHGTVVIDVRALDVNAFTNLPGQPRRDFLLIPPNGK